MASSNNVVTNGHVHSQGDSVSTIPNGTAHTKRPAPGWEASFDPQSFVTERAHEEAVSGTQPGDNPDQKLIGVDGNWYDVTSFVHRHPGGDEVLVPLIGHDASTQFKVLNHPRWPLTNRRPVGTYRLRYRHPADDEFDRLHQLFHEKGWYDADYSFYLIKVGIALLMWASVFYLVIGFTEWYWHYLGAVVCAFTIQQTGFIMHELMHQQVFKHGTFWNRFWGTAFGTTILGFSAHWWQDEHIMHHMFTSVADLQRRIMIDIQLWEISWAQHPKLFPLFKGWLSYILIRIQHITFFPLVMFVGRIEIVSDSLRSERRWYEWLAMGVHWCWMCYLLSWLPSWREVAWFYFLTASVEGVFHFQLILSHYCQFASTLDEFHRTSWYVHQIITNLNLAAPRWCDFYYGGLNFHIEHHLYPKLARNRLRAASALVKDVCDRHGILHETYSMTGVLVKTLRRFKEVGDQYRLDLGKAD